MTDPKPGLNQSGRPPRSNQPFNAASTSSTRPDAKAARPKGRRLTTQIVAMSSAAILSVYAAGYMRTQGAEARIVAQESRAVSPTALPATVAASGLGVATPTASGAGTNSAWWVQPSEGLGSSETGGAGNGNTTVGGSVPSGSGSVTGALPATSTPTVLSPRATATLPPPTALPTTRPATKIPTPAPTATPASQYKDGAYVGNGYSRHGGVTAKVVIKGGKIVSAAVADCSTRFPCSAIDPLPPEVVATQAPPVDLVSGATDSSMAYVGAVQDALQQALRTGASG